jgi:hypothetical protein
MVTCPVCRKRVAVYELANADGYRGEDVATCANCASAAAAGYRAEGRVHRLERRDPTRPERIAHRNEHAGFAVGAPATDETWPVCEPCLAYLESRRIVRMKLDGRILRWLCTEATQEPRQVLCVACRKRPAARDAALRVVAP